MPDHFVAYYRVSTQAQGRSGLGLEAQEAAVADYVARAKGTVLAAFTEVETGKRDDRPELAKALALTRDTGACLIIAKLDRLARNARFLLTIVEGAGDGVVFCDMPHLPPGPVGKFMVTQMAAVAELEAGLISQRTKAALAQAKARGVRLGGYRGAAPPSPELGHAAHRAKADAFAERVRPQAEELRAQGLSLAQVAEALNARHLRTSRGGAWTATAVKRVLDR